MIHNLATSLYLNYLFIKSRPGQLGKLARNYTPQVSLIQIPITPTPEGSNIVIVS